MLRSFILPGMLGQSENNQFLDKGLWPFAYTNTVEQGVVRTAEEATKAPISYDLSDFISKYIADFELNEVHLFDTRSSDRIILETTEQSKVIVNFRMVNDYRRINRFLEDVNTILPKGGLFISSMETHSVRKERILAKVPRPFKDIYYASDFVYHRILPKIKLSRSLYFNKTEGRNRVLTKAEVLGRLYACGFEVVEDCVIDEQIYFVAKKVAHPSYNCQATYGPLIYLNRVGKGGKTIKVYKLRTMHPYAEYLQQYVYDRNHLEQGGKIKNDFRISKLGRVFRKYWIDELPMLINVIKGDLKIVGARPLSQHYFGLYPVSLQAQRTKFKPGLLPPFYADMPKTLEEIVESEQKYLSAYERNPIITDIKYFFKILYNILFAGKRSS